MEYFKDDGSDIILEAEYCEIYIPMDYLDNNRFAEDLGTIIRTFGVFELRFFDANGNPSEMKVLNIPTSIDLNVYDSDYINMETSNNDDSYKVKVLKYHKGEKVMRNNVIENSDNCFKFITLLIAGKLPNIIPYNKVLEVWYKNMNINSASLGVPSVVLEILLAAIYRKKGDLSTRFAEVVGKNLDVSLNDYQTASIRKICQYTSTFTGLTFEDIDVMVTTSLNRSRTGQAERESPMEMLLKL